MNLQESPTPRASQEIENWSCCFPSGRLWRKAVARSEIESYRAALNVISVRYLKRRTVIFVLEDSQPDPDFEPVSGELQDVYFATIASDD